MFFGKQKVEDEPEINSGEQWVLKGKDDPFEPKIRAPVDILDVKDGWIRYKIGDAFPDERMSANMFTRVYKKF